MGKHVQDDATTSATMRCAELVSVGDILGAEAVIRGEYDRGFDDGVDVGIDVEKGLVDRPVKLTIPAPPPAFEEDGDDIDEAPSGVHEVGVGTLAALVRAYR